MQSLTSLAVRATAGWMESSSQARPVALAGLETVLNEPQLQAVVHRDGPMLVLAGAGSGKTRVITYRIAHLLASEGVPPYRLLAVTFTNKAAREMRDRLEHLVGPEVSRDLWVGTFHATCARLLRRYHDAVGLKRDFIIYDESDQRALMARVVKALGIDERKCPPKQVLGTVHGYKQHGVGPAEMPITNPYDRVVSQCYELYQKQLLAANAVDFDDLILHVMRLAEDRDNLGGDELRRRFDYVLVDEFQDANPVQYRLVRALVTRHHNLCVVGDDDQSIYRWRGADVRIIRGFKRDFSETRIVKLEQNYRSTGCIVRAALGVIAPSPERQPKELFTRNALGERVRVVAVRDERDEAAMVVQYIREALAAGTGPRDIAIFYRIHAQSRVLEEALRAEGVPYQIIGGIRFFDRAEVKDLLSYLRVITNPSSDVDLLRIINVPVRGIGQTSINRLVAIANRLGSSLYEVIVQHLEQAALAAATHKKVEAFVAMMERLRTEAEGLGPRAIAERVLEVTGYALALTKENTAEADARLENLREMMGSLEEYEYEAATAGEEASLSAYLERVALVSDIDQLDDTGRVALMTVHGAKGLEFPLVLLTGMEEDMFPYRSASALQEPGELEEERRLGYVAVTRARTQLVITHAATRMIFGTTRYCRPSRFIADMPADVVENITSPALGRMGSFEPYTSRANASSSVTPSTSRSWRTPAQQALPAERSAMPVPPERYVVRDVDPEPPEEDFILVRGSRVEHARYGSGEVHDVVAGSSPAVVVVAFPAWGKKKIVARFLRPV